ncbi:MAG: hypothetical protein K2Q18_09020, partial [Bdellovibrionales bacterium]|nr:hypothetical protein [Bdellovibrionales bacterium]
MSLKYRIRLQNERVIGPFSAEEIGELFLKDHIVGTEMCQQFPIGDWKALLTFPNLKLIIDEILNQRRIVAEELIARAERNKEREKEKEEVKLKSQTAKPKKKEVSEIKVFNEFKFEREVNIEVDYEELEKKYQEENPDAPKDDGIEKTVVIRKKQQAPRELDKTVIAKIKPEDLKKSLEELKLASKKDATEILAEFPKDPTRENIVELRQEAAVIPYKELVQEKTEFINLAQALPSINAQLSVSEVELDKQAKVEMVQERRRLRELQEIMVREQAKIDGEEVEFVGSLEDLEDPDKDGSGMVIKKKKKGLSTIAILAFIGIFYFFLQPDEKPKIVGPIFLEVKFPIVAPNENIIKANTALAEARNLYTQGTYKNRALATGMYLASLQNRFSGNEAMGEITLTYAELLN